VSTRESTRECLTMIAPGGNGILTTEKTGRKFFGADI
jgi:hypothetical protein